MAISAYNQSVENEALREKIYRRFIYPAFMKLSENIINKIKPDYIDSSFQDLQTDLVTFLTARLNKFNPNAGKAYSYYTRTALNYIIAENQKGYAKVKADTLEIDIDDTKFKEWLATAHKLTIGINAPAGATSSASDTRFNAEKEKLFQMQ
jgi:hypothetical protein